MIKSHEIKCFVLDDELHAIDVLTHYVDKVPFLKLSGNSTNVWEAIEVLKKDHIDLLFLDIQMPELNGLDIIPLLPPNIKVIITSAYSEYAIQGFEFEVTDYLLKPFSFERFLQAVNRVELNSQSASVNKEKESNEIIIKGDQKNRFFHVQYDEIVYLEALKNYIRIHCSERKIITMQTMKEMESILPQDQFIRTHRSYIINRNYLTELRGNQIILKDIVLPVGTTYKKEIHSFYRGSGLK